MIKHFVGNGRKLLKEQLINKVAEKYNTFSSIGSCKGFTKTKVKTGNQGVKLTQHNPLVKYNQMSPTFREEMKKSLTIMEANEEESIFNKDSQHLTSKVTATNYLQKIDSRFEVFFTKRDFTLNNFNYLLSILASQKKPKNSEEILIKMRELNIKPDEISYLHLMNAYAKSNDLVNTERVFNYIETNYIPNKFTYNCLLLAYSKQGKVIESEAIIREMYDKGLQPDMINVTTLILSYAKTNKFDKCWDIYNSLSNTIGVLPDEYLMSYMIRLCAKTHDAEKALNLFEQLEAKGFMQHTMNYNSLIFALASRKHYAPKALEMFIKMKEMNLAPDHSTYIAVLKATSLLGDIHTANDVIKEMKILGLPVNEYIINGLIKTYAGACQVDYTPEEHIEEFIKDAWEVFDYAVKEGIKISINVLNSLLEVHSVSHKVELVDGLVLPLYEKHNVPFDVYTYEKILKMQLDLRNLDSFMDLFEKALTAGIVPNQRMLNYQLEVGIRNNDSDTMVNAIRKLKELGKTVDPKLIKTLSFVRDMPDRLYIELKELSFRGIFKHKIRKFRPATYRERPHALPKFYRRNGKRLRNRLVGTSHNYKFNR